MAKGAVILRALLSSAASATRLFVLSYLPQIIIIKTTKIIIMTVVVIIMI